MNRRSAWNRQSVEDMAPVWEMDVLDTGGPFPVEEARLDRIAVWKIDRSPVEHWYNFPS